ncbi:MAG: SAM-dependent chlorinase/fluorinase [Deltaproteobacteria bacterium]|nr:SAM-dependent chlorinase/fluorinase [Deltaproteobacteria bacterium]
MDFPKRMEAKVITLLSDFGYKDPFVGVMKGVIFGINPDARVIDLSHGIRPQDVMAGALALRHSAPYFPPGAIHVAVVDPGVGTERRPLLIEAEDRFFIGPDNGLLSLALEGKSPRRIIEVANAAYHLKPTSATFHGRDIFAPVAAHLSLGILPTDLGPARGDFHRLPWPKLKTTGLAIQGEIIYIDGFGNLVTNIEEQALKRLCAEKLILSVGSLSIRGLAANYSSADERGYVALVNSWGLLEIALYKGHAQRSCGAKIGDKVHIQQEVANAGEAL